MKTLTLLAIFLFGSLATFAQQDPDKLLYLSKMEKYRRMKNTGAPLTLAGGVLFIVGVVTLSNVTYEETYNGYGQVTKTATSGNPAAGALTLLGGTACLGAGIPLWIIGAKSEKKYTRKFESLSANININQQSKGLTLTYRF